jgi:hypothetical protein
MSQKGIPAIYIQNPTKYYDQALSGMTRVWGKQEKDADLVYTSKSALTDSGIPVQTNPEMNLRSLDKKTFVYTKKNAW